MPKVTAVEPQKKKKDRFNLYLDGKFAFGAEADTVLKYQITPGKELTPEKIDQIVKKEELSKLFDATLKFLSYRPRSQKEVEDYLAKKISKKENIKFSEAKESGLIIEIEHKLTKYKYLNDTEFAKWWIESRTKSSPRGKRIIKIELMQKGVSREIVDELLERIKNQKLLALSSIEKKLPRWRLLPRAELKKKIYNHLSMRGFDFDTIREVVAQIEEKG